MGIAQAQILTNLFHDVYQLPVADDGAIHQAQRALTDGVYRELLLTNRQYAFARHGDHQAILTAANNDDNAAYLQVPLPFHTTAEQATDLITGKSFLIDKNTNKIQIELEGNSAVILGITEG